MKKIVFFNFLLIIVSLSACLKIKNTYVNIKVITSDENSVPGETVYMSIDNPETIGYPSPSSASLSFITNNQGVAEFTIPAGTFVDYGKNITRYFTVYEKIDEFTYEIKGIISLNIEYGENIDAKIILNN